MTDIDRLPPVRAMSRARRDALRDVLEEQVRRSHRPWWRRSWQGLAVGGGAFTLVLAGGAATAYVAFLEPTDKASVVCYSSADLDASNVPGVRVAVADQMPANSAPSSSGTVAIDDPVAACSQAWQDGLLPSDDSGAASRDAVAANQVPPLVACTLDEGVAAVFPGDPLTCERLGLPQAAR
jgi:hypothetical protein